MTTHFLGLHALVAAEDAGAAPSYQVGASAGNDEAAQVPARPPLSSNPHSTPMKRREELLHQIRTSTELVSTPADQLLDRDRTIDALPAAVHEALRKTMPDRYTPDLANTIAAQAIANLTGVTSAPCPVFRDCVDTTPGHYDHFTHDVKILDDSDGSTILDAGMVANSGSDRQLIVYLRNAEFTDPASVRAKTAEVRAFLDEVDEMADRVFADHQARTEQADQAGVQA